MNQTSRTRCTRYLIVKSSFEHVPLKSKAWWHFVIGIPQWCLDIISWAHDTQWLIHVDFAKQDIKNLLSKLRGYPICTLCLLSHKSPSGTLSSMYFGGFKKTSLPNAFAACCSLIFIPKGAIRLWSLEIFLLWPVKIKVHPYVSSS